MRYNIVCDVLGCSMVINLKQLYDVAGSSINIDYAIDFDKLSEVKGYTFINPVSVKGKIVNRAGVVTLNCSVCFTLKAVCDRCLCEFERQYNYDFEHILVRSLNTDSDEYVVTESDCLDLDDLTVMDILLQLPTKMLCREDCKGLCPICGIDLNYNECTCNGQ